MSAAPHGLLAVEQFISIKQIASYGLAGAFTLALLERLVPVVPSYGLFIFLGSVLAVHPGDLMLLTAACSAASTLGAICWYGIGYWLGEVRTHEAVRRYGRYVWLKESVYLSLAARYERNAFVATFVAQTIPVVRCYLSLPAGILALPLSSFALAVLAGSMLWVGGFTSLGYGLRFLGWDPITATLCGVAALVAIEGAVAWLAHRWQRAA